MTRLSALSKLRGKAMGKRRDRDFGRKPSVNWFRFLDDVVQVSYSIMPPFSLVSVCGASFVPYKAIPKLPEPPERVGGGENVRTEVEVPGYNATLVFIMDVRNYRSKLYGPYLKK